MDTNNSRPANSGHAITIAGSTLVAIASGSPIAAVILAVAVAVVLAILAVSLCLFLGDRP
ncbi:hypothetical protein LRL17_31065 (plasmid) [Rhodococcus qingshengii]|uniref:hypothetical protein n=1 Tax=Rhodococcus qingshengii TaxID=334542 RepID=UPI001E43E790|nr:hypothetical protein [Rhodococcus qingshengii]UGQ55395.1 hypothetical protein LRL17_31065 [Rhodococcus qingshengii]